MSRILPPPWNIEQQENAALVLNAAFAEIERNTDWGHAADGRRRLPCPEQPLLLLGAPLGQYHCPGCDDMQIAGLAHLPPTPTTNR